MCLIALAHDAHPDLPLVLAANRDEDYDRPTLAAGFWNDAPNVVGGRDARHRGSWLAVTREGRVAAVTNVRGGENPSGRSRGLLVSDYVKSSVDPAAYARNVADHAVDYAGFHLVTGIIGGTFVHSGKDVRTIAPGSILAISNGPIDSKWKKVAQAEKILRELLDLTSDPQLITLSLLQFLGTPAKDANGIEGQVFVTSPRYGTRSSTVIVATADEIHFTERSYSRGGVSDGGGVRITLHR
ncbi:MAG TPA: NRDE family protein [Thermoanaerobaculia bacterium]|jgi:uncharacterized protein with NRDE domain|nr:NRDE family protein [Thermoanaerobaculia bacterium]